jgi:hypothetical protein
MSAGSCIVYYGLRLDVSPDEIEGLENRSDERIVAARKTGLKSYWGKFDATEDHYLLFIGGQIGVFGPENQLELELSDAEFEALVNSVRAKLAAAGFEGTPRLYIHWQSDT